MSSPNRVGWFALVAATACWGSVVVAIKIAARGVPVQTITLIETTVTVVLLAAALAIRRTRLRRPSRMLIVAGLLEPGLAYPLINAGLARTSGAHGAIIIGAESAVIVLSGAVLLRSWPPPRVLAAVAMTVAGAAIVGGGEGGSASASGDLLVAAGILCASAYVTVAQRLPDKLDAVALTFWQFVIGAFLVVPITAVSATAGGSSWWGQPSGGQVAAAFVAGALGSTSAFVLYNWALLRVGNTIAGVSLTLIPVFGIAFAALVLSEPVTALTLIAAAVVVTGVGVVALARTES